MLDEKKVNDEILEEVNGGRNKSLIGIQKPRLPKVKGYLDKDSGK